MVAAFIVCTGTCEALVADPERLCRFGSDLNPAAMAAREGFTDRFMSQSVVPDVSSPCLVHGRLFRGIVIVEP